MRSSLTPLSTQHLSQKKPVYVIELFVEVQLLKNLLRTHEVNKKGRPTLSKNQEVFICNAEKFVPTVVSGVGAATKPRSSEETDSGDTKNSDLQLQMIKILSNTKKNTKDPRSFWR